MGRITDRTALARGTGAGTTADEAQTRPLTARCTVAMPPASVSDSMWLTSQSILGRYGIEVPAGQWAPRPDGTLPTAGVACCVTFDDQGDAWVGSHWSPI